MQPLRIVQCISTLLTIIIKNIVMYLPYPYKHWIVVNRAGKKQKKINHYLVQLLFSDL